MAQPIPLEIAPRNAREELRTRLERVPDEHAEAILAACELLQTLHDQGLLEIARGVLNSRDEVLQRLATNASSPEAIRAIRNLFSCGRILGGIEPDRLLPIFAAIPDGIDRATDDRKEPVSVFSLLRGLMAKDSRRALAAGIDFLQSFGRRLLVAESRQADKRKLIRRVGR
jgi:uncharacterized protein YjgD (DUF1641 family)